MLGAPFGRRAAALSATRRLQIQGFLVTVDRIGDRRWLALLVPAFALRRRLFSRVGSRLIFESKKSDFPEMPDSR
jgi:hypothetical protein